MGTKICVHDPLIWIFASPFLVFGLVDASYLLDYSSLCIADVRNAAGPREWLPDSYVVYP